eukprot:660640-Hanusia_phi.AAC.2
MADPTDPTRYVFAILDSGLTLPDVKSKWRAMGLSQVCVRQRCTPTHRLSMRRSGASTRK